LRQRVVRLSVSAGFFMAIYASSGLVGLAAQAVIRRGDTFWRMATNMLRSEGVSPTANAILQRVAEIQAQNPGVDPNHLAIGQTITLPDLAAPSVPTPSVTPPPSAPTPTPTPSPSAHPEPSIRGGTSWYDTANSIWHSS